MTVWIVEEEFPYYDGGDVIQMVFAEHMAAVTWIGNQKHPKNYALTEWEVN